MDETRKEEIQQLAATLSVITTQVTTDKITGFLSMVGRKFVNILDS